MQWIRPFSRGLLPLIVLAVLTVQASARLGETREQIESRFGRPIRETRLESLGLTQYTYANNDLRIGVIFDGGKSVSEQYIRASSTEVEDTTALPLPEGLARAILDAQAEGEKWNPRDASQHPGHQHFTRSDGHALAAYTLIDDEIAAVLLARPEFFQRLTMRR